MKNKKLKVIIVLILLTVLAFFTFKYLINNDKNSEESDNSSYSAPPTELEQKAGDEIKENQPDANEQNGNLPSSKESTSVVISDANQYERIIEVRAFMPSVLQDGTCKLTFSLGNESFAIDEKAYADASSTICTASEVSLEKFSKSGSWELVVGYDSDNYYGSTKTTVEINK